MAANNQPDLAKGTLLNDGRYEIVKEIGKGGFGNVFLVIDNENEKEK
jgi:serine/threonine protein kinase